MATGLWSHLQFTDFLAGLVAGVSQRRQLVEMAPKICDGMEQPPL